MSRSSVPPISHLPQHVAIVPDGNGRWAERRGWPRLKGHRAGAANMHRMIRYLNEYPIKYVTLYGFSTENWSRPQDEVSGLFHLLEEFIITYVPEINSKGISLRHVGRLNQLPEYLQIAIKNATELTSKNDRMVLNVAFNYGGRSEIVDAARRILTDGIRPEDIDEKLFKKVAQNVALLQLFPYHSEEWCGRFANPDLKTVEYTRDLAKYCIQEGKIIIIARGRKYWFSLVKGLRKYENLYTLLNPRQPHISPKNVVKYKFAELKDKILSE